MHQAFFLVVAGFLAAASTAIPVPTGGEQPTAVKPAAKATPKPGAAVKPQPKTAPSPAASKAQAFFRRVNLAPLLRFNPAEGSSAVMNGFYSYEYWRLEFVLLSVKRDAKQPNVYHVRGKSRLKRRVTPFSGTITLTGYAALPKPNLYDLPYQPWRPATVSGTFAFRETSGRRGVFSGQVDMDVAPDRDRQVRSWCCSPDNETRGGGILFEGQWRSGKEQVPVIWKDDLFGLARQILTDFEIGSRDVEINHKYARKGWDTYWENEEWWAESPVARL